ncbi:hypothetical protein SAMN05421770_101246 [Granulicella rosea]|uniref:SMI1/KNR4 family protein n=1 Tax=Granulicella rosea TaxID=474952 RepID=A0A239D2M2_9BACT|nr:hypothetical protein [Granulicella rosea]SNS26392.1 hypothetical protein SAMN05421770_101246 [Granulicella rosea]
MLELLALKNGFYAFESALHVLPVSRDDWFNEQDLQRWNDPKLWKHAYGEQSNLNELMLFAEDVIGVQFGFLADQIVRFDPETGETEEMCSTLDEWAEMVLSDYDTELGYPLAREWQKQNGPLQKGNRLVPIVPLIAKESSFEPSNFYQLEAVKGMLARADLAMQLKSVPDNQAVILKAINVPR